MLTEFADTRKMNNFIFCIKWGDRYPPKYVNSLFSMVRRNLSLPHRFICFTENPKGIDPEVEVLPLPDLSVDVPTNVPGKWRKIALWQKELYGLNGVALFIDLDTVIVGSIDEFFEFGNPDDVVLTKNWLKPFRKLGQTTLFRYPVGRNPSFYDDFVKDSQNVAIRFQYEQHYITHKLENRLCFWPSSWVKHYRYHCLGNNYPLRYFRSARLPSKAKIIAFPGVPNPEEAQLGVWNSKQPSHPSRIQHIRNAFRKERRTKENFLAHLKCYHLPCAWVGKYWK